MNKYELKVTVTEIDSLIGRRRFKEAAEVADAVDWRKVRNVRTLCRVSDVYKINKRYDDSKKILELAYVKNPYARQIIFSLCELELKLGNYVRALQLYNEYINVAPRDADRFVLQYKLYKAQNVSVNERIAVLEELARHDMRDRWAFELARLYLEAGERNLCASQCDEIIAFFGDGRYVLKALEKKGLIERKKDPSDGRRTMVTLTQKGREYICQTYTQAIDVYHSLIEEIGEHDTREFLRITKKLLEASRVLK